MMIHRCSGMGLGVLLLLMFTSGANGQTKLPGPHKEGDERLVSPLLNAHIPLNEGSLINALKNADTNIAARAASALARFPKNRRIVRALESTIVDGPEIVALNAAYSLLDLNEKGWIAAGAQRLAVMQNPLIQIQFAGILARAGNTAGWPIMVSGIVEGRFTAVVLENVDYFDGKIGPNGHQIKLSEELVRLSTAASEENRALINEKLSRLRK